MKKVTLFAIAVVMIGLASCGNAVKNANGSDSTSVKGEDTLRTADLSMFFLQGPVKTVSYQRREEGGDWEVVNKIEFDKEGRLAGFKCWTTSDADYYMKISYAKDPDGEILIDGEKRKVERDAKGRITMLPSEYTFNGEENEIFGKCWEYKNDRPAENSIVLLAGYSTTETFMSWNEKLGLPIAIKIENSGKGYDETTTETYSYKEFDEWGNFIEREIDIYGEHHDYDMMMIDDDESNDDEVTVVATKSVERRIITYYE